MKFCVNLLFYICIQSLLAQSPEITVEKRLMSLGERTCYKVQIPYQEASTVEKITNKYLKSQTAESVKAPKGSNEIIYKSVLIIQLVECQFII